MNYSETIRKLNPSDSPMVETDYWAWLEENTTGNFLKDKHSYLESKGLVVGVDKIDKETIKTLRYIGYHYWGT